MPEPNAQMSSTARLRLFIRDYISEFGCAWSVARMRDCERAGGHRWGPIIDEHGPFGRYRVCSRCKCSAGLPWTSSTANLNYPFGI